MTDTSKKVFLLTTIIGSFLLYTVIYYAQVFRDAPFIREEFQSFNIRYGTRDKMVNYYNSATGEYDYLNKRDSLVKTQLHLTNGDIDTLHKDAAELGFWDFPSNELDYDSTHAGFGQAPRYVIQFNYKRKSKQVQFDASFSGPIKLIDANKVMIKDITKVLSRAEERQIK